MTPEEKRARHRAYQKAYYAKHRDKVLARAKALHDVVSDEQRAWA